MGLMGVTIDEQKEIIRVIVSEEQAPRVFEAIYLAGKLDTPGKGIMYISDLDNVATYVPEDVLLSLRRGVEPPMLIEIGSMLSIDAGTRVFDKLKNHDKVEYVFHETGRSNDLFEDKQFGEFGEASILTVLVDEKNKDEIFAAIFDTAGLKSADAGVVFTGKPVAEKIK